MPKVIGAGSGRTGTMSLKIALEKLLGGSCYHMAVVLEEKPEDIDLWRKASRGEPVDWVETFHDHPALVDWPVARFYRELLEAFPDAKFVLTVRDPERWHTSASASIYAASEVMKRFPTSLFMRLMGKRSKFPTMADEVIWDGHFGGRFEDRDHAIAVFEKHIEDVKAHIPEDQLLVFDVKDGWGPLCAFLGAEELDEPFPRSNETAEFKKRIFAIKTVSWVALLFVLGALASTAYGVRALL
jgi:hypothetical protein